MLFIKLMSFKVFLPSASGLYMLVLASRERLVMFFFMFIVYLVILDSHLVWINSPLPSQVDTAHQ